MKDLALLHDKHMNRPTLDDSTEEEHAIEITTQEITQVGPRPRTSHQIRLDSFCITSSQKWHQQKALNSNGD